MARKKKYQFPKALLQQINECSSGGFILFNLGDKGSLEVHSSSDGGVEAAALQHYVEVWAKSMEALGIERAVQSMTGEYPEEPEDGEEKG